jgi:phosphosulfolactate phosphohydrolase-like enzyme
MSTTNGTRAFIVGRDGARMLACAFTNLSAVAARSPPTPSSS